MVYKALVVDDELHGRENISFIVSNFLQDVEVVAEAADLEEATSKAAEYKPDIIFLDIHIGDEIGFDLIGKLGDLQSAIIIVSGHSSYGIQAVKKGVIDYILKPISIDDMKEAVDKAKVFVDKNRAHNDTEQSRRKSDALLVNMLPGDTISELMESGKVAPKIIPQATVMFADFKGFTFIAEKMTSIQLIQKLDTYFARFDEIILHYGLDKIKTMGDGYLCAGGLQGGAEKGAVSIVHAAMKMQEYVKQRKEEDIKNNILPWDLRIGIHTGEVVAGVIGRDKLAYDIWGDTVNYSNRLQSICEPGKIVVSGQTSLLVSHLFDVAYGGKLAAKNKEEFDVYYIEKMR